MGCREILLARFSHLYASLDESSLTLLPEVYHREIHFVVQVDEHRRLSAQDTYFRKLLHVFNVTSLRKFDLEVAKVTLFFMKKT